MPPRNCVIIDTDPGVDDVLAILLALSASAADLEIILISVTFGNIDVRACLRNIVAIFHVLDQELTWRRAQVGTYGDAGSGFESAQKFNPLVAIGADGPLQDHSGGKGGTESADYFHGRDGLGGIHTSHPHFSPEESWEKLFEKPPPDSIVSRTASQGSSDKLQAPTKLAHFTASHQPAHKEILRLLRENDPDTITIIAIGPLTNCALAAAEDSETFLKCKELISMGGAVKATGNVTPVAEFNVFADPYAAARIYALTSPKPASTMPPLPSFESLGESAAEMQPYPPNLPKTLNLTLMALDLTEQHVLTRRQFQTRAEPAAKLGSPLAKWMMAFMTPMLDKMDRLHHGHEGDGASLALHDPMCVWYLLSNKFALKGEAGAWYGEIEDIRVETLGQWTKGMTVGDGRTRKRRNSDGEAPHDRGNWLGSQSGNRVLRMTGSPGREGCAEALLDGLFGRVS